MLCCPSARYPYVFKWARWDFNEGAGNTVNAVGTAGAIPGFVFAGSLDWSTPGAVRLAANGNVMTKVYQDPAVDQLFDLSKLKTGVAKCWYWAIDLVIHVLPTGNSRGGQGGDQGSAYGQKGGPVFRWNGASSSAPFTPYCATWAIHTPYNAALGDKVGGQSDADFVDTIVTDTLPVVVGTRYRYMFAADASRGDGTYYAMIYRDGVFRVEKAAVDPVNYPLPGISDVTINGSSGLRFFAQSDATGQAPLKDATVYSVMVGEAEDTMHLADIAAAYYANSSANPT